MNVDIARYRWTPEEEEQIFDQLVMRMRPKDDKVELVSQSELYDEAMEAANNPGVLLSSGFKSIDRMTKGIGGSDLVIVYGATSHGKSQLAQNIALNTAKRGHTVLFAGLEMTNKQNIERFDKMNQNPDETRELPIIYPKERSLTRHNVGEMVRQGVENGAKLVVIDQLQQMQREMTNSVMEISLITAEIKRCAVEYEVPIILVSHINRSGDRQAPPTLMELKGSSSIEQDCDIALAVWRDEERRDTLHVALRKNRNRGMEFTQARFSVDQNMRLHEELDMGVISKVFPGAQAA